ncbi:TonB-dependent receptor [Sphingobacterium kyonggiense]|uniref:TonB-dependent receptor n=1 Tax=Sphingobacterium kyonggiense TaxID=714075 RepID=A0ABP7YCM6_9SPHI
MKQKLLSFVLLCALLIGVAYAQNRQVSGKVTSQTDGTPISNVSVLIQGSNLGTQTSSDGTYSLQVAEGATLVFKYIGFVEKSVKVGTSNTINVQLQSDEGAIDEVVVVGYGSARQLGSVVGSVVKVNRDNISGKPSANALESLQGKVPGLQVFTSSGEPSSTPSIRLDGVGSLGANNSPLVVLDGVPVGMGSLVSMNPDDFESITVLRDASATSIYGSRAANGVLYITTRKGKAGERANITARTQFGWNDLASRKAADALMNSEELRAFWVETGFRTQAQVDKIKEDFPEDFRWDTYYYRKNSPIKQFDLNASGGSDRIQYFVSGGFFDQTGMMYRSDFKRINLRSNISGKLNKWVNFGVNLAGGYDVRESNGWGANSTNGGLALLALPWYTPFDKDGNEYYDQSTIPGLGRYSPRYLADMNPDPATNQQFNPNVYLEAKPIAGLTLRTQGGMDYFNYRNSTRRMPSYLGAVGKGTGSEYWQQGIARTMTTTAEYKWNIDDRNEVIVLGGHEYSDYTEDSFTASVGGLTDDRLILLSAGTIDKNVAQTRTQYAFNSFFGRGSYALDKKYFLDLTIRQDESSRFGKNNTKATFWSIGGKWEMKNEAFLQDVSWINSLALRASTGTQGNAAIGNYQALATVGTTVYDGMTGWGISSAGNPNLTWEKQQKTSVGISANLFNRVNLDLEYFNRNTSSQLLAVPYPYTSGYSSITSNVGNLSNQGINLALSATVVSGKDYFVTPYVNFGYVQQKITELFQGRDYWIVPNTGVSYAVNSPVEFFYPIQAGVNPESGLMQWYLPGDNIAQNNQDPSRVTTTFSATALQQSTGIKRFPPFNGGFGLNSGYKGFYVNLDFTFSKGKYLINNDKYFFANPYNFAGYNQNKDVRDYWKQPGDIAKYPKYGQTNQFDSGLIEDASFLRLKGLSVGYNLPKSILGHQNFFTNARVYYIGRNLVTWTKYTGPDPEVDSNLTYGANPNSKQSMIGIELQF